MIFKQILDDKTAEIQPEFDQLFQEILLNQSHEGDLLLVQLNAFYNPDAHNYDVGEKISPYMFGPHKEGHSADLHHKFIGSYLTNNLKVEPFDAYLKKHDWTPERKKIIYVLEEEEGISIQYEMLIYLKIWEADLFVKQLFQLTTLAQGEPYDWHFKIAASNRDKTATGSRQHIINKKIKELLDQNFPLISKCINNGFNTQVRNSIAHSKYSFIGRHIHLNNKIESDPFSQLEVLSFNEWIDIFHDTLIIYTQTVRLLTMTEMMYGKAAVNKELLQEIRINRKDPVEEQEYRLLKYRPQFGDWYWKDNDPE